KTLLENEDWLTAIPQLLPTCRECEPLTCVLASFRTSIPNSVQRKMRHENLPECDASHNVASAAFSKLCTNRTHRGKNSQSQFGPTSGHVLGIKARLCDSCTATRSRKFRSDWRPSRI